MRETLKALALLFAGAIASVIGGILLSPPVPRFYIYVPSAAVIILILYGSGAVSKTWHTYNLMRRKGKRIFAAKIGILADIDWKPEEWDNAWSDITPEEWKQEIEGNAKQNNLKVKVKLISTARNLDPYTAILSPYGGVYPEADIKNSESLNKIFNYVSEGGTFINVSDIPGYWQYNPKLKRMLDATPPIYYGVEAIRKFELTPFMERMGLKAYNTERAPVHDWKVEFVEGFNALNKAGMQIKVQRTIAVEKNVKPIIKPIRVEGIGEMTPLCLVYYGKGIFIISLPGINRKRNPENIELKRIIPQVLSTLIMERRK
jgi:hypothetical protein